MRHASRIPHPASRIPHPASRLLRSPEVVDKLREILAAKDKEIEELTKQLGNVKVKAEDKIVGLYGNKDGTIVRAVYQGADKGNYTKNPGGGKKYLKTTDADNWVVMDEDTVNERVAAHDAKMAALKGSSPAK